MKIVQMPIEINETNCAMFGYTTPEPSLCDTCIHKGFMPGGSTCIGIKQYIQRYCGKFHIAIHTSGRQECEGYKEKPKKIVEIDPGVEDEHYRGKSKEITCACNYGCPCGEIQY